MKNVKNIFMLSATILAAGLSLTGCSEDNLNTNPYSRSGVNIVAFGPSPILRTNEIRITGTNLTSVSAVAFPGGTIVEKSGFNSVDAENIYVDVPDESVPGKIHLLVGADTVSTSTTLLTFEEPISVTSVSPTTAISAGDEIIIKGDYVYNIAEVIFTCGAAGAPVAADDFTLTTRREIHVPVPLEAMSGKIILNDGASWELEWSEPLEILTPEVSSLSSTSGDFGSTLLINGSRLHTVKSVMFGGGVSADFTVSDDHNTITVTVPAECKSGAITLVYYSGESSTAGDFNVPTLAITGINKDKDLKVGDQVVITGENFDRITKVSLPGYGEVGDTLYTISGNTLTFTVDENITDGVIELTQNAYISVSQKISLYSEAPEEAIWTGTFECVNWAGSQDLAWGGYDWSQKAEGTQVKFYYKKINAGQWACISLRHGDNWGALPDPIPGQYELDEDEGVLTVTFTKEVMADIIANNGLVITGDNYTLTKVTLPIPETIVWTGSFNSDGWAGNQDLAWGGYDWSTAAANSTLIISYKKNNPGAWACISLRHGDNWGALPDPIPSQYELDEDEGALEVTLPQNVLDDLTTNGGLVITGDNYTMSKVTLR